MPPRLWLVLIRGDRREAIPEMDGLTMISAYYGEPLGLDLVRRVAETPDEQIRAAAEYLRENGLSSLRGLREEDEGVDAPAGSVAADSLMLDWATPAAARPGLDLLLLVAPVVLVADPIWGWVDTVASGSITYGSERLSATRQAMLTEALMGLVPLKRALDRGYVRLVRPPIATSDPMNRLWLNPTTMARLEVRYHQWGMRRDNSGAPIPGTFSPSLLYAELDGMVGSSWIWNSIAEDVFLGCRLTMRIGPCAARSSWMTMLPFTGAPRYLAARCMGSSALRRV